MINRAANIQSKIWRGYSKTASVIGEEYKFYRTGANGPQVFKYDHGLRYNQHKKYDGGGLNFGPNVGGFDGAGMHFDEGGAFDQPDDPNTVDQTVFDAPGAGWDSAGAFDQPGNLFRVRNVSLNAEDMKYGRPNKYGKPTWYALMDGTDLEVGDYFIGPGGTFFIAAMQLMLPILAVECNRIVSVYRPMAQSGIGAVGYGGVTDANMTMVASADGKQMAQGRPCSILQGTKGEKSATDLPDDTRSPWWTILLPYQALDITFDDLLIDDLGRRYSVSSPERSDLGHRLTCMSDVP